MVRGVPTILAVLFALGLAHGGEEAPSRGAVSGPVYLGPARGLGEGPRGQPMAVEGAFLGRDGSVHRDRFTLRGGTPPIELPPPAAGEKPCPLPEVAMVVDKDGVLLYVRDLASAVRDLARLMCISTAKDLLALAGEAAKAGDPDLIAEIVALAQERGATEKELAPHRKRIQTWREKPPGKKPDRIAGLRTRLSEMVAQDASRLRLALEAATEDDRWPVRRPFVEALLAKDPKHPAACSAVRAALPPGLGLPEEFDSKAWMAMIDFFARPDIRVVTPPPRGTRKPTLQEAEVGRARELWRPDVVGVERGPVLLITAPVDGPGILRCLSFVDLVDQAMQAVFAGVAVVRKNPDPLILHRFDDVEDLKRVALRQLPVEEIARLVEKSNAWYSPDDGVTSICLPSGVALSAERAQGSAWELAQHWILGRCPLWEAHTAKLSTDKQPVWVWHGFTYFVQGFAWDLDAGTWQSLAPSAAYVEVLAKIEGDLLLPWDQVLAASSMDVEGMTGEPAVLYRLQAAAAFSYLWHRGSDVKRSLLAALQEVHAGGGRAPEALVRSLGLDSATALGTRVVTWVKEVHEKAGAAGGQGR